MLIPEEEEDFSVDVAGSEGEEEETEGEFEQELEVALEAALSESETEDTQAKSFFPTASSSEQLNQSLIAQVLAGKDSADRAQVLRVAYQAGVEKDDPLFAVLLATGQLEQLLFKKPDEIEELFQKWKKQWQSDLKEAGAILESEREQFRLFLNEVNDTLSLKSKAALDVQKRNISNTVSHLVRQAAFEKVAHDAYALIGAGLVLLGAVGIGVALGLAMPKLAKAPELDPAGPRQLTLEEASALDWGLSEAGKFARSHPELIQWTRSKEGRYARQFMQWNQTLLSGSGLRVCEREVSQLGVTLRLEGREAKSGFCTLWTLPPEKRSFVQ